MRKNLNTILLVLAVLLLAYLAFLKPERQRFVKSRGLYLFEVTTGRLCDPRTPRKETVENLQAKVQYLREVGEIESEQTKKKYADIPLPAGFVLENTKLEEAESKLRRVLHPSKYPLCSEL